MPQKLGTYTFDFDPDFMDIPRASKQVESLKTWGGNAIFEWSAILEGVTVELRWNWMKKWQYFRLRKMYLMTGQEFTWDTGRIGNVYTVVIEDLRGEYFESILHGPGVWKTPRRNVVLRLNIREATSESSESSSSISESESSWSSESSQSI